MTRPARAPGIRLEVSHETIYHYPAPVELAHHLAFLRPLEDEAQQVLDHTLRIEPTPSHRQTGHDVFGNGRSCFSITTPHRGLRVQAQSVVAVQARHGGFCACGHPAVGARARRSALPGGHALRPGERVCLSLAHGAAPACRLGEYALDSFTPGRALGEAALDLMGRLHRDMRYEPASTDVSTPVLEAFERREGVCQDFAHILISCLRTLGLSARYVSGYLLTEPPPGQPRLARAPTPPTPGSSVYCPGASARPPGSGRLVDRARSDQQLPGRPAPRASGARARFQRRLPIAGRHPGRVGFTPLWCELAPPRCNADTALACTSQRGLIPLGTFPAMDQQT